MGPFARHWRAGRGNSPSCPPPTQIGLKLLLPHPQQPTHKNFTWHKHCKPNFANANPHSRSLQSHPSFQPGAASSTDASVPRGFRAPLMALRSRDAFPPPVVQGGSPPRRPRRRQRRPALSPAVRRLDAPRSLFFRSPLFVSSSAPSLPCARSRIRSPARLPWRRRPVWQSTPPEIATPLSSTRTRS